MFISTLVSSQTAKISRTFVNFEKPAPNSGKE